MVAVLAIVALSRRRAKLCDSCAEWNAAREPFRVHGDTYYVGTGGLSAVGERRQGAG